MSRFLADFAASLRGDTHAIMVLDQAGWHGAKALKVPETVTLVPLPPSSPDLHPVERVWLYLRERYLSHRLLAAPGSWPSRELRRPSTQATILFFLRGRGLVVLLRNGGYG